MQGAIGGATADGAACARPAPRLAGLDGLRAVAVIAVFLYHTETPWARGGFLGVDVFFVISGFLITHLLAGEVEATSTLDLGAFYWRRAKRLLPASWLMTAAAIVAAWALAPDALPRLKGDTLASLAYVTNWELLAFKTSYFEAIGRQPLLMHLWSLAIEEQFYILWAPLLLFGLRRMSRRRLAACAALFAAALVGWTALLATRGGYLVGVTPTRLDFGTDTHSYPLLIGAGLGLVWRPDRQTAAAKAWVSDGVFTLGLAALGVTLFLFGRFGEETPRLYPWGFLLSALTSAALVAAATYRGALFGRWLDQQPLRWIGERSYGIYLWHWPIFMLTRPQDLGLGAAPVLALRLVLTVALAALSYALVETPIRRGLLERIWADLRTRGRRLPALGAGAGVALATAAILGPVAMILWAPPGYTPVAPDVRRALAASIYAASGSQARPRLEPAAARTASSAAPTVFTGEDLTAIGDSVLLGSLQPFSARLPGARVVAKVGWQARDVLTTLQQRAASLTPVVLIHLGTNGYVYEDQLRGILALLADRPRVIIVNAHVPRRWMTPNDDLIDRVLPDYPNAVLVDWRKASEGRRGWFVADGFHLTPTGQRALVAEIMRAGNLSTTKLSAAQVPDLATLSLGERTARR